MYISNPGLLQKPFTVCVSLFVCISSLYVFDIKTHSRNYSVVLVKDLPDIPKLQLTDGAYLDLGYRYTSFFKGEWIAYSDSKNYHRKLTSNQLDALLKTGKLDKLPPVPSDPALTVIPYGLATLSLFILALIGGSLRKKTNSDALARDSSHSSNLLAKMTEAAEKYDKGSGR